ncbi:MAG: hypothetical protein IPK04_14935 [Bdellovibrionales bacterium]|nr:hypothetical protein [Bdellovibrionales bacterium]
MSKTLKRLWTVRIEGLYKSDRDERLTKAFGNHSPRNSKNNTKSEVKTHEQNHSDLRQGLKRQASPRRELLNHKFQVFENIVSVKDTRLEEDLVFTDNGVSGTTLMRPGLTAQRQGRCREIKSDLNSMSRSLSQKVCSPIDSGRRV